MGQPPTARDLANLNAVPESVRTAVRNNGDPCSSQPHSTTPSGNRAAGSGIQAVGVPRTSLPIRTRWPSIKGVSWFGAIGERYAAAKAGRLTI